MLHLENRFHSNILLVFWRSLDLPLINCEVELNLKWSRNCLLIEHHYNITGVKFTCTKFYVLVVTLFKNDNANFLENRKQGFKTTISWINTDLKKQHNQKTNNKKQSKNNNLDCLIDLTFRNINRLFVLSFKNDNDDPKENYFDKSFLISL